jgi:predicted nucleic acid-binding protein
MNRFGRIVLPVALVTVTLRAGILMASGAQRQDQSAEIILVGADEPAALVERAIGELLASAGPTPKWTRRASLDLDDVLEAPADAAALAARVFVDLRRSGRVEIYFADGGATRFAVRGLEVPKLDLATQETIAQIVGAALGALLDPTAPALDRQQMRAEVEARVEAPVPVVVPDAVPVVAPARPEVRRVVAEARVGWTGTAPAARGSLGHAAGVTAVARLDRQGLRPTLWISGGRAFAWQVDDPALGFGASLASWSGHIGVGLDLPVALAGRVRTCLGLGVGVESTTVTPEGLAAGVTAAPATSVLLESARGSLGVVGRVAGPVTVGLFLHAAVVPDVRLVGRDDGRPVTLTSLRRVRPGVELSLGVEL